MVSKVKSRTLTWFDESDGYVTSADLDANGVVSSIPIFTDTGTGESNEASIILSAKRGNFVHSGTIQIEKYDRIRIQFTDLNDNTYDRYYEVIDIPPSKTKGEGALIHLELMGIEYHLTPIHFSKREWYQSPFNVAQRIFVSYELNNGSRQPVINAHTTTYDQGTGIGNGFPTFLTNHYEFGLQEEVGTNRVLDLTDSMGAPVENGGIFEPFEFGTETPAVNQVDVAIFPSGERTRDADDDANHVTIEKTDDINPSDQEGSNLNPTATRILAWGSPIHGSLPIGFSKYRGEELEFTFSPGS
jgi:hypothetical protein